jgi:hypothetical protein
LNKSAIIVNNYRYELRRVWDTTLPLLCFIMLNPSTADAMQDDATIRKCMGFARRWKYGGIIVVNLFALRSTDWRNLLKVNDPIGFGNEDYIRKAIIEADVICAWGTHGEIMGRGHTMEVWLQNMNVNYFTFGRCTNGQPKHPLMLGYVTERTPHAISSI